MLRKIEHLKKNNKCSDSLLFVRNSVVVSFQSLLVCEIHKSCCAICDPKYKWQWQCTQTPLFWSNVKLNDRHFYVAFHDSSWIFEYLLRWIQQLNCHSNSITTQPSLIIWIHITLRRKHKIEWKFQLSKDSIWEMILLRECMFNN